MVKNLSEVIFISLNITGEDKYSDKVNDFKVNSTITIDYLNSPIENTMYIDK